MVNIMSCVDIVKLCNISKFFPGLNQFFVKEVITCPLSSSSRAIKRKNIYLNELESCVEQFDTIFYHDLEIDKSCFKGDSVYTKGNETRRTFYDLFKRQHK